MTTMITASLPQVALEFMNQDHAQAAQLILELQELLNDALVDGAKVSQVSNKLNEIYHHTEQHFAHEESEMEKSGFPAYDCHRAEHERVLAELTQLLTQWQASSDIMALNSYINDTFHNWLVNHINTMDTVTAMFIRRQLSGG